MICITDANIWIDLHHAGLTHEALGLSASWVIPDFVLHELKEPDEAALLERGLQKRTLSGDEVEQIPELALRHPRPSRPDLAALLVAQIDGGILLTGDGALRKAARQEGVEVHGVLWVLDRMVVQELIDPATAADGLDAMLEAASRLPQGEVNKRLRRWRA